MYKLSLSEKQKWTASFVAALLFLAVSSPIAYKGSNALVGLVGGRTQDWAGEPTYPGLVIHTALFGLLTRWMMTAKCVSGEVGYIPSTHHDRHAVLAALLFAAVSAPFTYRATNSLAVRASPSLRTVTPAGIPTPAGLALHAVVFMLLTRASMELKI